MRRVPPTRLNVIRYLGCMGHMGDNDGDLDSSGRLGSRGDGTAIQLTLDQPLQALKLHEIEADEEESPWRISDCAVAGTLTSFMREKVMINEIVAKGPHFRELSANGKHIVSETNVAEDE
ncbi:hypothetical protein DCS_01024 [Drechmeria coniospora]|uniref:Uncharacterized protein n=1 Tax=Drechmeria coniospora TaxID=98403 RepID=A0A151GS29_DRECN|nr:hypothetical protein DCS_01024 [Drechmeria coniospora]KYK59890.1 hypothetical protein DCS_01024 [Drechmeria coniospora]